MMGATKEYNVSIVTGVYNVEKYLEEMIESIIAQTIGFENIQLILIDDGSADGSGQICDKYAAQYPDNIVVKHKENGGVSSARNEGLKYIKGEYVNFTDADDMLEHNALELMYAYLKENEEEIDFVAIEQKLFERENRGQSLNYKFSETRIIDLQKEYDCVHFAINSTLIKRECFKDRYFDIGLLYGEDASLLTDICLEKMKYGIVCGTSYMYRKRNSNDSALDLGRSDSCYYIPYINKFILRSLENAKAKKGYIPQFVQYACMYDLQWRLRSDALVAPNVLSLGEEKRYKALIVKALQYIDNEIIRGLRNCTDNVKEEILSLKGQTSLLENIKEYKVSVITGVYNVEDYLEEMIESIVNQTIGFEYVQLILVDDGSTDGSGEICDRYEMQYPDNIVVVHKENGGASSARNEGLKHAEGEYMNFTDADDKLRDNALEKMYDYLKENEEWIDLVAIRLSFFGTKSGNHSLNYRFNKTRLADLRQEHNCVQLSISGALVKSECFTKRRFDTGLSYAEDGQLVVDILLDKMRYGILCGTNYFYRKRDTGDSAIDQGRKKVSYYNPYMERFILYSLKNAMEKKGYVPQFVQYTCMYDLQWRLNRNLLIEPNVLTEEEGNKYKQLLRSAVQYIDNNIILEQKNIGNNYKMAILSLKEENRGKKELVICPNDIKVCIEDISSAHASSYSMVFEFADILPQEILIEGYVRYFVELDNIEIILKTNGGETPIECKAEPFEREEKRTLCMDEVITEAKGFRFRIRREELPESVQLFLYLRYQGNDIKCNNIIFGKFFPLSTKLKSSYLCQDGMILSYSGKSLKLSSKSDKRTVRNFEKNFQKEILSKKNKMLQRGWFARNSYHILKRFKKKELWLISDRLTKADDNGEAFFTYMNTIGKNQDIETYFVLDKDSEDYERLHNIGKVVSFQSTKHKVLSLMCDKIISSQGEDYIFNRFYDLSYLYKDIQHRQKFVFLQHGVTKDNQCRWLAKANKNISLFVTVTNMEYQSILDYDYYYDENQVKCVGFPRYDYLYDDSKDKNVIVFMPTWRSYLAGEIDVSTDSRILKSGFENSSYCKMYQQVFSDDRLYKAMSKFNYELKLMLHPTMPRECVEYFNCGDRIEILDRSTRYRKLFADAKLIITDYSSTVFDFAYLRKPVLYYQKDVDEFFSGNHTYDKGYFDYERDGFGEVEYTAEALVDRIIEYMENGCQLKELYRDRIERTFPYNDKDNCKRVYEEIIKL